MPTSIVNAPTTLSPLPPILHQGLTAVSVFGFLSFLSSVALFTHLAYRLLTWNRKSQSRINQFIILIFNLVLADIQQSIAFLLNAHWLQSNAITAGSSICWAQGWFVSTGDLASGVFTFAIAVHSYCDIIWDFRLGYKTFLAVVAALWTFVYAMAIIGVAMHPEDFYMRAGAWCWINSKYTQERLWLHYFWIIIAEFGTVLIYTLIVIILRRRVLESFYTTSDTQVRAQSAAKLIIAYPIVYVVCTLPLVIARLTGMAGGAVSFVELSVAGAMITSNGWLDVLLYSITRRTLIFGPELDANNARALDTFRLRPDQAYGTTTTIEASHRKSNSKIRIQPGPSHCRHGSTEELVGFQGVKAETIVRVQSEAIEMEPISDADVSTPQGRSSFGDRSRKSDK